MSNPNTASSLYFLEEFKATNYYLSPEISIGQNDQVFFTFKLSMDGNYTITVNNAPMHATDTMDLESGISFDNPVGTTMWYYTYTDLDSYLSGNLAVKLAKSSDKGKTWSVTTAATWQGQGENIFDILTYLQGTAVAATPDAGVISIITWVNCSDLYFIRNTTESSWSAPLKICDASTLGYASPFSNYPKIETGILPNGTIVVLSESASVDFTPIVYLESHDNGTTWSSPQNISCIKTPEAYKPKLQVNFQANKYWLMWRAVNDSVSNNRWAQFNTTTNLGNDTVLAKNVTATMDGNYDFILDGYNKRFLLFQINDGGFTNTLWAIKDFTSPNWGQEGIIDPAIEEISSFFDLSDEFCFAFDGHSNHFFYTRDKESGEDLTDDVYHYIYVANRMFWVNTGNFTENTLMQVPWDGKINGSIPINSTRVKVSFEGVNGTKGDAVTSDIYLNLDNNQPKYVEFMQNSFYFNPQLQNMYWNVAPSEAVSYRLEVFQNQSQLGTWQAVTTNNFNEDREKLEIFSSSEGQLYVIYTTYMEGLQVVNLIRSEDGGVSWTSPVTILECSGIVNEITAAAYEDIVVVFISRMTSGYNDDTIVYRSFNQGQTFEQPLSLPDEVFPTNAEDRAVTSCCFSSNGTLFTGYLIPEDEPALGEFHVVASGDFGHTWNESRMWFVHPDFNETQSHPVLLSDETNDLIHVCMPQRHIPGFFGGYSNYSFCTLNLTTNTWGEIKTPGLYPISPYDLSYSFLLLQENRTAPISLKLIHLQNVTTEVGVDLIYEEFTSTDLGQTWSAPQPSTLDNMTIATSQIGATYYAKVESDGNDQEVYIARGGKLVCVQQTSIPHSQVSEISFDGRSDAGDYLPSGNYSYAFALIDYARNRNLKTGWFYIDYTAPIITGNPVLNWSAIATPQHDMNVTIQVTDEIGFDVWLHYRQDGGDWHNVAMTSCGDEINPQYSGEIPADVGTRSVQYYITATDYANNARECKDNGQYFEFHTPSYIWTASGLFNASESYSSSINYTFNLSITSDLAFVDHMIFHYSLDGTTWNDLILTNSGGGVFTGMLAGLSGDLRELQYEIIVVDAFGEETTILAIQQISFYPELPKLVFTSTELALVLLTSAIVGLVVAFGYVKLKGASHKGISRQILATKLSPAPTSVRDVPQEITPSKVLIAYKPSIKLEDGGKAPRSPFTLAYVGVFIATIVLLLCSILLVGLSTEFRILILAGSLLVGIFGFMILMSRDISLGIYLEKFQMSNVFLEIVQVGLLLYVIINILQVGYLIPWFRYYLIDSTYDFFGISIPKLFVSILGVFFTSLVLVLISTYLELRRTVGKLSQQRVDGGITGSALLYLKEENSTRLISNMGIKTVVFLVTVLITIITTTDLLNTENVIALVEIAGPFAVMSFLVLFLHPRLTARKKKLDTSVNIPFLEAEKACTKCGTNNFLSSKFCKACGTKLVFTQIIGQFVSKCAKCGGLLGKDATFCTSCGIQISEQKPQN